MIVSGKSVFFEPAISAVIIINIYLTSYLIGWHGDQNISIYIQNQKKMTNFIANCNFKTI